MCLNVLDRDPLLSFDHKPELTKSHGKQAQLSEKPDIFFGRVGPLRGADWEFKPRGQSGLMVSEMFPHVAEQADKLTVIRSMTSQSAKAQVPLHSIANLSVPVFGDAGWPVFRAPH